MFSRKTPYPVSVDVAKKLFSIISIEPSLCKKKKKGKGAIAIDEEKEDTDANLNIGMEL